MLTLSSSRTETCYGRLTALPAGAMARGGAIRVRSHEQILDTASALVSEGKSKKGQVAIRARKEIEVYPASGFQLKSDTSNTTRLDPEDRMYDQYQHVRDWREKSSMKMLQQHILVFHVFNQQ
jgi:hypothetical protein